MPTLQITPWPSPASLVDLGCCFYGANGLLRADAAALERGCDLVDAYARRVQPPHAVVATAALARAILLDDGPLAASAAVSSAVLSSPSTSDQPPPPTTARPSNVATHAAAALYATAFAAFVTGYLDNRQTGAAKRTMYDLAAAIDMPPSFVTLRHAIVHEGYAGLRELRRQSRRALAWLWSAYWERVVGSRASDDRAARQKSLDAEDDAEREHALRQQVGALLDGWAEHRPRGLQRNLLVAQAYPAADVLPVAAKIAKFLGREPSRRRCQCLVDELLSGRRVLSASTSSMEDRNRLDAWAPLLRALVPVGGRVFVQALVSGLVTHATEGASLSSSSKTASSTKLRSGKQAGASRPSQQQLSTRAETQTAAFAWMRHLCNHPAWVQTLHATVPLSVIARPCLERSGPYSTMVASMLVASKFWEGTRHASYVSRDIGPLQSTPRGAQSWKEDVAVTTLRDMMSDLLESNTLVKASTEPIIDFEKSVEATEAAMSDEGDDEDVDMVMEPDETNVEPDVGAVSPLRIMLSAPIGVNMMEVSVHR